MSTSHDAVAAAFDKLEAAGVESSHGDSGAEGSASRGAADGEAGRAGDDGDGGAQGGAVGNGKAVAPASSGESDQAVADKPRDGKGKFTGKTVRPAKATAKTPAPAKAEAAPDGDEPPAHAEEAKPLETEEQKPAATTSKPPPGWKPTAKEHWAKLPAEVQSEVMRREKDVSLALNKTESARKFEGDFNRTIEPFRALIASSSGDPLKSITNLMQTAAGLQLGAPAQKMALVESIIGNFGVPVDAGMVARLVARAKIPVEELAAALDGTAPPPGQQPQRQEQPVDPRAIAAQVRQELTKEFQTSQQHADMQRAQGELDAFAANAEFIEPIEPGQEVEPGSVRDLMAQELELDARLGASRRARGERHLPITLEQAYTRACQRHSEVSGVLKQRDAAKQAGTAQAATQRAKAAASSVRTQPAGERQAPQPKGTRAAVEAAWDALEGRT